MEGVFQRGRCHGFMIVDVQYVSGGQVRTFISGGGIIGQGEWEKKVTLRCVSYLVEKGEHNDR